jgi:hypothetical protein
MNLPSAIDPAIAAQSSSVDYLVTDIGEANNGKRTATTVLSLISPRCVANATAKRGPILLAIS